MLLKTKANSVVEYNTNNHAISGDLKQTIKDLQKEQTRQGVNFTILNGDLKPTFKYLDMNDLVSLQSQREAKSTWARDRISQRQGLDLIALGVLLVARDPKTGIYYVWDGCGRWLLLETWRAFADQNVKVPCLIWDIEPDKAKFYFSYTQSEGRRSQSAEVIFINYAENNYNGEGIWIDRLKSLDLYVKNDCMTQLPKPNDISSDANEVRIRSIKGAWDIVNKKTKNNETLKVMKQVVDIIKSAHRDADNPVGLVRQDMLFALAEVLTEYRFLADNDSNRKNLIKFLATQLMLNKTTDAITAHWKNEAKGLTGNTGVSKILAHYFCKTYKASPIIPESLKPKITYTKDFALK